MKIVFEGTAQSILEEIKIWLGMNGFLLVPQDLFKDSPPLDDTPSIPEKIYAVPTEADHALERNTCKHCGAKFERRSSWLRHEKERRCKKLLLERKKVSENIKLPSGNVTITSPCRFCGKVSKNTALHTVYCKKNPNRKISPMEKQFSKKSKIDKLLAEADNISGGEE